MIMPPRLRVNEGLRGRLVVKVVARNAETLGSIPHMGAVCGAHVKLVQNSA